MIKKLVVVEFTNETDRLINSKAGEKFSYFQDPETGKYYRPVDGFTVTINGDGDLSDRFIEVPPEGDE